MADQTLAILQGLSPSIQQHAYTMVALARQAGVPLILISGRRTEEENRRAGGAEGSLHLWGLAFDVAVQGYTRDQIPTEWWEALGTWAETYLGLRWGGRFLHGGVPDVNHFDLKAILA